MALATIATAGSPGTFNGDTPANLAELVGIQADPLTAWADGEYVQVGSGTVRTWSGDGWVAPATEPEPEPEIEPAPALAPRTIADIPLADRGDYLSNHIGEHQRLTKDY